MAENNLEVKVGVDIEITPEGIEVMVAENKELKAALTDLVKAYLTLSRACGAGIDALNNHAKVVMSLGVDLSNKNA